MLHSERDQQVNEEKFYGNYRGEVVSVGDPAGAGRIKVRVFGVFDDLTVNQIPWCEFADPFMGGHAGEGGFLVPNVGAHVWVFFEAGDHMQPVYFAGAPAHPHGPGERYNGNYPNNKVFRTRAGHLIEIDDSEGGARIHVVHNSGTHREMQNDGSVLEEIVKDLTIHVEGDAYVNVEGDVQETVKGNVNRVVEGDVTETVKGNFKTSVHGNRSEMAAGDSEYACGGTNTVSGARVDIN